MGRVRLLRALLLALGIAALIALVYALGARTVAEAVARVTWWQFGLVCLLHGLSLVADTVAWQLTLAGERPPLWRLYAARCAGEAFNIVTAVGSVGGEAVKAWLLRHEVPYAASIPSLILAKTSQVTAQTLLVAIGVALVWAAGPRGEALRAPMTYLLAGAAVAVGGFVAVQVSGLIGRAGRLLRWIGGPADQHAGRLDRALRGFYRDAMPTFLGSVAWHFVGWLLAAGETYVILRSLRLDATAVTATIVEALGAGVRFATFMVPASLGTLEGANAAAFPALGWAASAGLAFTLVRRGRQAVWVALGVAIVLMTRAPRAATGEPARTAGPEVR